jgi:protein-tyrosine phosphatase/membrane-associated phospholipid phosphatase
LTQPTTTFSPLRWLTQRPWPFALLWLSALAPFFYWSYGLANRISAEKAALGLVPSLVFDWEKQLPFIEWTIVPYWTINFFYGLSLFLSRDKPELHTQALRLLTAQVIAVSFFIFLPLRYTFGLPDATGMWSFMYDALRSFDLPFNQAPSLHIALAVILWDFYQRQILVPWARWILHVWTWAICISVLTTYQHHFIDIPTGALLGFFCLWVWPMPTDKVPLTLQWARTEKRRRLALYYGLGSVTFVVASMMLFKAQIPVGLWLLWPATSLLLVALNYLAFGASGFQAMRNGSVTTAGRWLYLPYRIGAWLNSRWWTRRHSDPTLITEGVYIGRHPGKEWPTAQPVLSLCAELNSTHPLTKRFAWLDLTAPQATELIEAAKQLNQLKAEHERVLVSCALGYSRSVAVVATWLVCNKQAPSVTVALARIRQLCPWVVVSPELKSQIELACA